MGRSSWINWWRRSQLGIDGFNILWCKIWSRSWGWGWGIFWTLSWRIGKCCKRSHYHHYSKSKKFKVLQKQYDLVTKEAKKLNIVNKNIRIRNGILEKDQFFYVQKRYNKPLDKHEFYLQEFIISIIEASYVCINKGERVGFS